MDQDTLSLTAATVVAAAFFELYPDVELRGSRLTSFGFVYNFFFPHPLSEETLFHVEEKMRQIIREKRPIRTLEMVPLSARELLLKEGHRLRVQELDQGKELVQLAQIGSFCDLVNGPLLKNTMELGACKILSLEKEGKKELCICGVARRSKAELKDFLKKWASYSKTRHEAVGARKGFWKLQEGKILWLSPGLKMRQKLIDFLKEQLFTEAIEIESPLHTSREAIYRFFGGKVAEILTEITPYDLERGLFYGGKKTTLQVALFSEKGVTSLLQTIGKTLTMLGFSFRIRLSCPKRLKSRERFLKEALEPLECDVKVDSAQEVQVDFLVEDGLGRSWEAASLVSRSNGLWVASIAVERNLALLVEKEGNIFEN